MKTADATRSFLACGIVHVSLPMHFVFFHIVDHRSLSLGPLSGAMRPQRESSFQNNGHALARVGKPFMGTGVGLCSPRRLPGRSDVLGERRDRAAT